MFRHSMLGNLILNPNCELITRDGDDKAIQALVSSPVRGRGLKLMAISDQEQLKWFRDLLSKCRKQDGPVNEIPEKTLDRLYQHGVLIQEGELSNPVFFKCSLEDYLDRNDAFLKEEIDWESLKLNSNIVYSLEGAIPESLKKRLERCSRLDLDGPTVWVPDPVTEIIHPYSVTGEVQRAVEAIIESKQVSKKIEIDIIKVLRAASIIVDSKTEADLLRTFSKIQLSGKEYLAEGYSLLPLSLLNRFHVLALQRYYKDLIKEGWVHPVDEQVPLRMSLHNEAMGRFFHLQMGPLISRIMGAPWKPSYSFWSCYKPEAVLEKHVDRPQSGISLSFQISYEGKDSNPLNWPLKLELKDKDGSNRIQEVKFGIGDGVLFDGMKIPHYREKLAHDQYATFLFLFFVPASWEGRLS